MNSSKLLRYLIVPAAIALASLARYALVLNDLTSTLQEACPTNPSTLALIACNVQNFFSAMFSTGLGAAYMASLLAFITGALTVTHVESARLYNKSSWVVRHPILPWVLVNIITGSASFQLLFTATLWYQSSQGSLGAAGKPARQAGRPLTSVAETIAIPLAVVVGFLLPSLYLIEEQHPWIIVIWNLFPLWVSFVRVIIRTGLSRTIFRRTAGYCDVERHYPSLVRLYGVPILVSTIAHCWLLVTLWNENPGITPACKFMIINGESLILLYAYWIFYESNWKTIGCTAFWGILLGPGAGLCIGWTLQELFPSRKLSGLL